MGGTSWINFYKEGPDTTPAVPNNKLILSIFKTIFYPEIRVMTKRNCCFIEKIVELFEENGAKTLTMDDIAKEFGISKNPL